MLNSVFALLAIIAVAYGASMPKPTDQMPTMPKGCPGGVQEGATSESGRYWYTCTSGMLVMKGCLSEARKRLNNHETFKSNGFVFECVENNGDYTFKYKGCVGDNGDEHMGGDSWQDDNYWYMCTVEGDRVKTEVKGCVDGGKRLNVGDSVNKADLTYQCKQFESSNIGWNIFPNRAVTDVYDPSNPDHDLQYKQQRNPAVKINT